MIAVCISLKLRLIMLNINNIENQFNRFCMNNDRCVKFLPF
jgi:hypothetical protein